ncbi:cell division protein ZipA [Vibrio sp. SM6]|uniref:Cell division protein ZipA n=1 Tax=Vibrio agarilyticus TaxID=2726741 RepID=A0A7X8TNB5_9VIBR|nr:cell division protein ZipA [Vibrio agarilyticus]NLS11612.1 cell division protein ZipA [Vibrio agarilyticus]
MQELRFILIIVGGLFIAAILFHGLWTSKKEGHAKFGDKPLNKLEPEEILPASNDDYDVIRKPAISADKGNPFDIDPVDEDPLVSEVAAAQSSLVTDPEMNLVSGKPVASPVTSDAEFPSFSARDDDDDVDTVLTDAPADPITSNAYPDEAAVASAEPEMEVIVLNVKCGSAAPFKGHELVNSMNRHGLFLGEMAIFHRTIEPQNKVIFSVANMMQPGTLDDADSEDFTTEGVSLFMTLPGFGSEEQNFNQMLQAAQQIADDLSGHVLDERRNLLTPDRIKAYRRQIVEFHAATA